MAFDYTNYTPVEYIGVGSTTGPYIKTDIHPYYGIAEMEVEYQAINTGAYQAVMGCRAANSLIVVPLYSRNSALGAGFKGKWNDAMFSYAINTRYSVKTQISASADEQPYMEINGVKVDMTGTYTSMTASSYYFDIFAYNSESSGGNTHQYYAANVKLYDLKWSDLDSNLLYHFVPCISKDPTPVPGLYEVVNEKFFANSGSGSFIYGSPIVTGSNVWIKDSGTWKQADTVYIKDAGVWKAATNVYIKDSGSWKS